LKVTRHRLLSQSAHHSVRSHLSIIKSGHISKHDFQQSSHDVIPGNRYIEQGLGVTFAANCLNPRVSISIIDTQNLFSRTAVQRHAEHRRHTLADMRRAASTASPVNQLISC
jgi:hypothetical protein